MLKPGGQAAAIYERYRRAILGTLIALLAVGLIFVGPVYPGTDDFHENLEILGLTLIVTAILGRMWCTLYIGGSKNSSLVTDGPYSLSRNPLYVFSTIGAAGIGAQMGSVTMMIGAAVLCYVAFMLLIRVEEDRLSEAFGETFQHYIRSTPRFFPKFSGYRERETVTFKPHLLRATLFDGLVFFIALPVFEVLEAAQDSGFIPVLLRVW
ncbi:methyltransferase family protein [Tepidamorphus sp. 3E244]|uniref:methyltransferase family protein n=1 Tax=Tepidamorphus sp. 3E244 TaxID=3385498 RepID=UPI0038FC18E5